MNSGKIDEGLLARFLAQECTGDDFRKIEEFIAQDESHARYLFELERVWGLKNEIRYSSDKELKEAYTSIQNRISMKDSEVRVVKIRRRPLVHWVAYAASVLVAGLFLFFYLSRPSSENAVAVNKIEVPTGERVAITLSDGTKVWLNSRSSISYPSDFSQKERRVHIDGEGYFEVAPDTKKPFIVESAALSVKVLGTSFNFKAYREEAVCVSLLEGELEAYVSEDQTPIKMLPNDEVEYSYKTGLQKIKRKDVSHSSHWISGELYFSEQKLSDIVSVLNRKFITKILIQEEELKSESFSCRVHPDASLIDIMELLKETRKLDYYMEDSGTINIITRK